MTTLIVVEEAGFEPA